jgi:Ca-activated chloride channel family protein
VMGLEFASPWVLVLLVPVVLLPLQGHLTGTNRLAVPRLSAMHQRWTLRLLLAPLPRALQVLGLALLVLALARPQVVRKDVWVESDGLDIILAVDTSGSMRADDFSMGLVPVNRLQVAKGVMAEFVKERPNDRIGVVVFGEEAFTQVPLTLDHDTLADMLEQVEIGVSGATGTAVGTAIAVSAKRLKDLDAQSKIVILLTDGRSNAGRIGPIEAAQAAAALGIKVYTIGVGAQRGMGDGIDEEGLGRIAEITGAKYFRATDSQGLMRIYDTINELEPSPAEVIQLVDRQEHFRDFLIPALALLALQSLLSATFLRRAP